MTGLFAWINVTALSWTYFLSVFFLLSCIFISWQDLPGNKERREKLDYMDKQVSTVRMVIFTIVITTIFTKWPLQIKYNHVHLLLKSIDNNTFVLVILLNDVTQFS